MSDPRDETRTRPGRDSVPAGDSARRSASAGEEPELSSLLAAWHVGVAPARLRSRVFSSYRREFGVKEEGEMGSFVAGENFGAGLAFAGGARGEYRLTLLEQEGLLHRLAAEVSAVARDSRLTREELRRDPLGFARRLVAAYGALARRRFAEENVGYGVLASLAVMLALAGAIAAAGAYGGRRAGALASRVNEGLVFVGMVEVPKDQPRPDGDGAGMSASGHGGGQKAKFERPGGGGGGGRNEATPAVHGKLPQATLDPQLLAPDPKPPAVQNPQLPTAATIRADPVLFPPDTRAINYGDPKSQATELSSGSGTGGGIGEGTGGGVGVGSGTGYGAGEDYNTGGGKGKIGGGGAGSGGGSLPDLNRVFTVKDVTRRAQVVSRPEPLYTEEARKNQIVGTVRVKMVFNANGTVTNVSALTRLPDGLTEKAIEAAHRIKFVPAEKDGRKVSQWVTIDYNFNIY